MPSWISKFRVPINEADEFEQNAWCNNDLIPIPKHRRTYGSSSLALFWATGGFSIVNYTTGASFIAYGLSGQQSLVCALVAPLILTLMLLPCAWIGANHHIGFTVSQRFVHGMRGSFIFIIVRSIPCLIYDGIEAYWGGQAVAAMIGAMAPSMYTTLDVDLANGTLKLYNFIGFIIFYVFFLITMRLPPERLQIPFAVTSTLFVATVIGLLVWSVQHSTGAGPYFNGQLPGATGDTVGWSTMFGLMAFVGNFSPTMLGAMDWTRYSKSRKGPMITLLIAPYIFFSLSCAIGIVVASCGREIFGTTIWQPYLYLQSIQSYYNNSGGARAAVFFAGLACAAAQVNVNIILNSMSVAMDWSALAPRWINIRRGSYLVAILGLATCPWAVLSSADTFLAVLAGFGCFYGPMCGLTLVEYFYVRKQHLSLADLYVGGNKSIYWYTAGFNWRSIVGFFIGLAPTFPGFIMVVREPAIDNAWVKMYHFGFLLGCSVSALVHVVLCTVFPPAHRFTGVTSHQDVISETLDAEGDVGEDSDGKHEVKDLGMMTNVVEA